MAKNNNLTDLLTAIANAIRTKKGTQGTINPQNFDSEIASIPTQKEEQSKTLTLGSAAPTTVNPDSGKVLSSVPVSIDSTVIKAENIAQGTTILGIEGTHSGGGQARLKDISPVTSNGRYVVNSDVIIVDSMTGTGNGYFPTDIVLGNQTTYEIEACIVHRTHITSYQNSSTVFGCQGTASGYQNELMMYDTQGGIRLKNGKYDYFPSYNPTIGTEYTFVTNGSSLYINDVQKPSQSSSSYVSSPTTLDIFALHKNDGTHTFKFSQTFKYLKIKNTNGDVLYWFVPARNANNEPLIYEKINAITYSLVGSGITLGNDVSDESYDGFASPIVVNVSQDLFGLNINEWIGTDNNGTLANRDFTGKSELRFTGLKKLAVSYALAYRFYANTNLPSIIFPDLEEVSQYGLYYAFYNVSAQQGAEFRMPKLKKIENYALNYMCNGITNIDYVELGSSNTLFENNSIYGFGYAFQKCNLNNGFRVKGLQSISSGSGSCSYMFASSSAKSNWTENTPVEFTDLETINTINAMQYVLYSRGASEGKKWNVFPKLISINQNNVFGHAFRYFTFNVSNSYPQKQHIITFPRLQYVGNTMGYNTFTYAFANITGKWKYCWFPMLKTIGRADTTSYSYFSNAFQGTIINDYFELCFPELENLLSTSTTTSASLACFYSCTIIKKFWLPKLNQVTGTPNATYMFRNCTQSGLEIHFGIENQAYIESLAGYASKFGATNATIYFDCVNHIVVGGVTYDRDGEHYKTECPIIQTSGGAITHPDDRYSWKDSNGNVVYTLECWTPAVGDNVYDANDNIVGTITAIS